MEHIEEARRRLKTLKPKDSIKTAIIELWPDIDQALKDGLKLKEDIGPTLFDTLGPGFGLDLGDQKKRANFWRLIPRYKPAEKPVMKPGTKPSKPGREPTEKPAKPTREARTKAQKAAAEAHPSLFEE